MSLIDCVTRLKSNGTITDKQGTDILFKARRLENMYRTSGNFSEDDIVNKASRDALDNMLNDIRFAQYQEALSVEKLMQRRASIDANAQTNNNWAGLGLNKKGFDRAMVDELLRVQNTGQAINGQATSKMYDFAERFRSKIGGNIDRLWGQNKQLIRQVVRSLHGDEVSKEAKFFADMYKQGSDFIFDRKLRAGININRLENFGISHRWDSNLLKSRGKDAFIRDAFSRLDRTRMVAPDGTPLDDANLNVVLGNIYRTLTGGTNQALPLDGQYLSRGGGTSLRSASESSRVLHFKDGQNWLDMHDMYGTGDIFENMLSQLNRGAQDVALFERFGPNPQKVFNSLQQEAKIKNQMAMERGEKVTTKKIAGTPDQMWRVLVGSSDEIPNPKFAEAITGIRNFQSSAKLGQAVLSNLTDQAFAAQQMSRWGGSYLRFVHKWFQQLKPGNVEDRKLAAEMLLGLEWTYNGVSSATRFGDVDAIGKFSRAGRHAADFTIRTSGLNTLNRASRSAAGLEINSTIARNAASSWRDLDPRIKLGLQDRSITEADWNVIRSTTFTSSRGAKYIDMQRLLARNEDISTKFASIIHEVIRKAAPEPDLQARAITTGGGAGRGTAARELSQTFLQFKTFPITVLIQNFRDQMFDPRLTGLSNRFKDAATLAVFATVLGGGIVQLKNIAAGKDFENPFTLSFFLRSIAQGGSLGIISDAVMLASQQDRSRAAEILLPPAASMAVDLTTSLAGGGVALIDGNYDRVGRGVARKLLSQTPGKTFYTKLALERLIFDQMEEMVRPNAYTDWRRYQRSLRKRTGQEFWWKPGEKSPERLPEFTQKP